MQNNKENLTDMHDESKANKNTNAELATVVCQWVGLFLVNLAFL